MAKFDLRLLKLAPWRRPVSTAASITSEKGPLPGDHDVIIESVPAAAKKGATTEAVLPLEWKPKRRIDSISRNDADFLLEPMSGTESEWAFLDGVLYAESATWYPFNGITSGNGIF